MIASEEKVRSSLKNARTTLVNIDIFVNTRDELESYGIYDLSGYSNLRLANRNLRQDINSIFNTEDLENIQNLLNRINQSSSSINNSENSKDRKYLVLCDSFF